jgi:hypothetical protein
MQDTVLNLVNEVGLGWWVEIVTESPPCTYYFGPFVLVIGAHAAKAGYVEDLEKEGAQGIRVSVKRCKPEALTVFHEQDALNEQTHHRTLSNPSSPAPAN